MLIDTHSHIYEPEFDGDRAEALQRCLDADVRLLMLPAIDGESYERMFDLVRAYPEMMRPMMGLHPTSVNENPDWRADLQRVEEYLQHPPRGIERFCGVGEIGLDFYWSNDFCQEQIEAFKSQIEMAIRYNLPIAVHTRSAWEQMCEVMEQFAGRGVRGIFHAFSDGVESYQRLKRCGDFLFGVGGVVTFKKSKLAEVVQQMELTDIVLETDCPYLTPVPHRGERNESSYVKYICQKIAELKGVDYDTVAEQTTANVKRIFNI
jgi:TatD DNase family protein